MLSVEEIKLIIEKLEKANKKDLTKLVEGTLATMKDIATALDVYNEQHLNKNEKNETWFQMDVEQKRKNPVVDSILYRQIQTKIFQFSKTNIYNSLEIGPGTGMFSKDFRTWRLNYFLELLPELEQKIRRRFPPRHQKYLRFCRTRKTDCGGVPQNSVNFVFSWDTFVFFTPNLIAEYLQDMKKCMIKGAYGFVQYTDCHYDFDMEQAKRGYWIYNNKSRMEKIITDTGYKVIEMGSFRPGANYAIFRKPGKQNPVLYRVNDLTLE